MKDILFKQDDFIFSYRVAGILMHEGKILLQRPVDFPVHADAQASCRQQRKKRRRDAHYLICHIHRLLCQRMLQAGDFFIPARKPLQNRKFAV